MTLRRIWLADWQDAITRAYPGQLVRGLIHSDGCRTLNRVRTTLPRGIFAEHCELLGIRVTQANQRNMSVARRQSVALLEEIVGPKR